jgi:ribosome maturation factor RimP
VGSTQNIRELGIRELAEPALASVGLELWDVEALRDVLRILVDRPGGIDLDTLTLASGVLSPMLDEHPELAPEGRYQLEVSSPGVERTLRTPDQYRRYVGTEITVKTTAPIEGARRLHGRLVAADEQSIQLQPRDAGPDTAAVEIDYDHIDKARTVLVWGPKPPPGAGRGGKGGAKKRQAASPATAVPAPTSATLDPKDTGP